MKGIFKDIEVITDLDKNITTWIWHFLYKGKDYFGFLSNRVYRYKPYHCMPFIESRYITPKEQTDLFDSMVGCMKELI